MTVERITAEKSIILSGELPGTLANGQWNFGQPVFEPTEFPIETGDLRDPFVVISSLENTKIYTEEDQADLLAGLNGRLEQMELYLSTLEQLVSESDRSEKTTAATN
jgi:hypothetical protein